MNDNFRILDERLIAAEGVVHAAARGAVGADQVALARHWVARAAEDATIYRDGWHAAVARALDRVLSQYSATI